ncbi:MAG: S-methyl-5-thioribose-1-phosphate isomerase [Pseudomonadales bacterium]|nr:S-methyl-5-thioribose-1-phosphate isomerase [Pseudomonadales bacterium]
MAVSTQQNSLQTISCEEPLREVRIIDQTCLPHQLVYKCLNSLDEACEAITSMRVRGAPLIGITAAFGVYLALRNGDQEWEQACHRLRQTRPTAVNLHWALTRVSKHLAGLPAAEREPAALALARTLHQEDANSCSRIGDHGLRILQDLWEEKQRCRTGDALTSQRLNILTHCNAGWLATAQWGTALAPIYKAHAAGIPVHVWVDETRPRNQGASLTAWELGQQGIPHTLIVDNAGGHLMQHAQVDICLVGSDRTTAQGDVCNKIGTYLKALAAWDNQIPFYAALPVSTIDFSLMDGVREIPIEERAAQEVTHMTGLNALGEQASVLLTVPGTAVSNFGFDVTPARLLTGLITELGVVAASPQGLAELKVPKAKVEP